MHDYSFMTINLGSLPKPNSKNSNWACSEEVNVEVYTSFFNKKQFPKVSIITPSFNQGEFIEQTIRSVLLQNYPNLQYIVIDGGSTDNTVQILEKYSSWIDYWVSEPDRGQSHAINKGLEICDGEWFNWINSDDYLMPGAIAKMIEASNERPNVKIITGATANIQDEKVMGIYSATIPENTKFPFFNMGINQPGSLLSLSAVKACNGVREDLDLCMDLDLWLRILLRNSIDDVVKISDTVAAYRYHSQSKTCSSQDVFALEEFSVLLDIYQELSPFEIPKTLKELRAQCKAAEGKYLINKIYNQDDLTELFFDRLIVSDSLLFRALTKVPSLYKNIFTYFAEVLEQLDLNSLYGHNASRVRAVSQLRAMQNQGRLSIVGVLSSLKNLSFFPTVKELSRIAIKGNK